MHEIYFTLIYISCYFRCPNMLLKEAEDDDNDEDITEDAVSFLVLFMLVIYLKYISSIQNSSIKVSYLFRN